MVARKHDAEVSSDRLPESLLGAWRRGLSRAVLALGKDAATGLREIVALARGQFEPLRSGRMQWIGVALLVSGTAFRLGFSVSADAWTGPTATAVLTLLLAGLRLGVLGMKVGDLSRDQAAVQGAWAFGLIPSAFAFSTWIEPVVFVSSALLTWHALRKLGEGARSAGWAVTWAWGAQAAVLLLMWLADNAGVAVLIRGA